MLYCLVSPYPCSSSPSYFQLVQSLALTGNTLLYVTLSPLLPQIHRHALQRHVPFSCSHTIYLLHPLVFFSIHSSPILFSTLLHNVSLLSSTFKTLSPLILQSVSITFGNSNNSVFSHKYLTLLYHIDFRPTFDKRVLSISATTLSLKAILTNHYNFSFTSSFLKLLHPVSPRANSFLTFNFHPHNHLPISFCIISSSSHSFSFKVKAPAPYISYHYQ